jgi:3D (Asp-Asp-Asp) domain-containing protein
MIKKIQQYVFLSSVILLSGEANAHYKQPISQETIANDSFLASVLQFSGGVSIEELLWKPTKTKATTKTLAVTATAYTSHVGQTDSTPNIAAWGDRLKPGMKAIAVSRDLLVRYKLKRGTSVKIRGLSGRYLVLDKMNKRWRKKIDIYMGMNKRKALRWGKKKVVIEWSTST